MWKKLIISIAFWELPQLSRRELIWMNGEGKYLISKENVQKEEMAKFHSYIIYINFAASTREWGARRRRRKFIKNSSSRVESFEHIHDGVTMSAAANWHWNNTNEDFCGKISEWERSLGYIGNWKRKSFQWWSSIRKLKVEELAGNRHVLEA